MPAHVVVYSHGFGVRKDSRGMFTDIAAALPTCDSILFDYNTFTAKDQTVVEPLPAQAEKLQETLRDVGRNYPDATIDLIGHSQGCVVAGMARPEGVRKIILLAPPEEVSIPHMSARLSARVGKTIDTTTAEIPRTDGTTTLLTPTYWQSLDNIDAIKLYNDLAELSQVCVITANQDDVLGESDFSELSVKICGMGINGNHNFDTPNRATLIGLIKRILL